MFKGCLTTSDVCCDGQRFDGGNEATRSLSDSESREAFALTHAAGETKVRSSPL